MGGVGGAEEESDALQRAIDEEVRLVDYDVAWPARFAAERERLLGLFPDRLLEIEHFGSTAVPGMPAKPIIDVLAGVKSMAVATALSEPIIEAGYTTSAINAVFPDRHWFMRVHDGRRTHHLHLVELGGTAWRDRLRFRDCLRTEPALAARYAALKAELAEVHRHDREAYTEAKGAFIASVLDNAAA